MDLLLGISLLILLIVLAMGLGQNKPKTTVHFTASDYGWLAVIVVMMIGYGLIVYG